jgi:hypothetical protein
MNPESANGSKRLDFEFIFVNCQRPNPFAGWRYKSFIIS